MRVSILLLGLLAGIGVLRADISGCACDPGRPETMERRECSLCREAEKQPPGTEIFFLKDANPRKPNRWLALPRVHSAVGHSLADLTPEQRALLWKAAIAKGRELWGDQWGLAYNGDQVRTQCHAHIHIGKLLQGLAPGKTMIVSREEDIPVQRGDGWLIEPHGKDLLVHYGEIITETVLLR
jgi:hypothetical protein